MNKHQRIHYVVFALLLSFCCVKVYAQGELVTVHLKNASLKEVFNVIEKQTSYHFSYRNVVIDDKKDITVAKSKVTVAELLDDVLPQKNLGYNIISSKSIVVWDKKAAPAEKRKVTGVVKDASGEPVIGANVLIKGKSVGTITDINGTFTLEDVPLNAVLDVSYIGYVNQLVSLGDKTQVEIELKEDVKALNEVVVVGYGTQKKINLTGAIGSVKSEDLEKVHVVNTVNSLSGKVPGLVLKQVSGQPGDNDPYLDIRGFGSPLIIIDGTQQGGFGNLDIEEIESINVLKDASAAVYGVQAGNGVILVTTKRGASGKPKITFNASYTLSNPTKYPKLMNAGQYSELYNEAQLNDGVSPDNLRFTAEEIAHYKNQDDPVNYPNTNWYDVTTKKYAPQQKYNLNVTGGNEQVKYFFSLGYADEGGLWKSGDSEFKRYNIRSNIDAKITKSLSASVDISGRKENRNNPNMSVSDIFLNLLRSQPIYQAVYPDPTKYAAVGKGGANGLNSTQKDVVGYIDTSLCKQRLCIPFP